jgi:hypothetical protein
MNFWSKLVGLLTFESMFSRCQRESSFRLFLSPFSVHPTSLASNLFHPHQRHMNYFAKDLRLFLLVTLHDYYYLGFSPDHKYKPLNALRVRHHLLAFHIHSSNDSLGLSLAHKNFPLFPPPKSGIFFRNLMTITFHGVWHEYIKKLSFFSDRERERGGRKGWILIFKRE